MLGTLRRFYFSLEGRTARRFYNLLFVLPSLILGLLLGAFLNIRSDAAAYVLIGWLALLIWPVMAVTVKRLHDLNLSGWWTVLVFGLLIAISAVPEITFKLIGQVGSLAFTVCLMSTPGTNGPNRFGTNH